MRFRTYEKIPGAGKKSDTASPTGPWVALEKIHGAQLVLCAVGDEVRVGKRKAWLRDDEAFFGWQVLRAELLHAARALSQALGAGVCVYGELHGGAYPHPEVAALPGLSAVQTGVWYGPGLLYAAFDMLRFDDDADDGELLAHHEVEELARVVGLRTPPLLGRGTLAELEAVPVRFVTRVPQAQGLPALPWGENFAEGLVVKPDRRAAPAGRAVYKRKIPEFSESIFDESQPFGSAQRSGAPVIGAGQALGLTELCAWAERLVNGPRLASARSKVGAAAAAVADEVVLDVLLDLTAVFPAAMARLDRAQEEALERLIRGAAARVG